MPLIAFLGPDGCGKSTILRAVGAEFESMGIQVAYGHWRPTPFKMDSSHQTAPDPHGKPPRSIWISFFKLLWIVLNWQIGWWKNLRKASRDGLVLFDRCYTDLLVDPRRYRYKGSLLFAKMMEHLVPRPDLVFVLDAEPSLLYERKQEISMESLKQLRNTYLHLAKTRSNFYVLDASASIENIVREVGCKITASIISTWKSTFSES